MAILKYKGSDGNFKPLANILVKGIDVVQTSGTSSADVMSQNAVTEFVGDVNNTLATHTSNTEIHVTAADKEKLHTHSNKESLDSITGDVGTMAYENVSSYSSATEVDTALGNKANTATTLGGYGITDAYTKSETSGATELQTAFNGKTDTATTTALNNVVTAHTANTNIHLTTTEKDQLHTHANKTYLDGITGNVGTMAYENVSSYSSATEVNTALGNKADKADAVVSAVTVSSDLSNVTCPDSITGSSKSGAQAIVIYENGGTTTDYTITVSTNYKSPDGSQISITCAKGGYCEVNYINVNGTIYARGA